MSAFVYSSVRCSSSVGCCFALITSPLSTCPQLSFLKGQTVGPVLAWLWLSINTCSIPSVSSWGCMVLSGLYRGPRPLRATTMRTCRLSASERALRLAVGPGVRCGPPRGSTRDAILRDGVEALGSNFDLTRCQRYRIGTSITLNGHWHGVTLPSASDDSSQLRRSAHQAASLSLRARHTVAKHVPPKKQLGEGQ
jgi:hypothetical protein